MRDCLGPAFSSTPRISAWNSSMRLPEKMVRPVACIPGRISASGKNPVWAYSEAAINKLLRKRMRDTRTLSTILAKPERPIPDCFMIHLTVLQISSLTEVPCGSLAC